MREAKRRYSAECVQSCLELRFSAALKLYPCEDDLFPRNTAQHQLGDSLSERPWRVGLWHSSQEWQRFEHFDPRAFPSLRCI